ncbi:MAG: helix-turn-helix domain-containing protein [Acidimicrobiales bacterium]
MTTDVILTHWKTDRSVHETAVRSAEGLVGKAVRGYVGYEEWPAIHMVRREIARCGISLVLAFGDPVDVHDANDSVRSLGAFAVGNQAKATLTELGGHQHGVQVELTPAAALGLFGKVGELNNTVVPIDEALGRWAVRLVDRLGNIATWAERFALLDETFGALELPEEGGVSPEVAWLRRQLLRCGGRARVEPLMDETGRSRRFVTERFRTQLGVPPKAYARILRFQRAVGLLAGLNAGRTLADVAIECGYYDQSHLNRDFVALAGCAPGTLMAESTKEPAVRFLQDNGIAG